MDHHGYDNPSELYSDEALKAVETIEFLPFSRAFEQVMYENRLTREASYEYAHHDTSGEDLSPIHLPAEYLQNQLPDEMRDSFLGSDYTFHKLRARLSDTPEETDLVISFEADGIPHTFVAHRDINGASTATHITENIDGDTVSYALQPKTPIQVLATLLYARQRYPFGDEEREIDFSLEDRTAIIGRPEEITFAECVIETLGDHAGTSQVTTTAIFDLPGNTPSVVAKLTSGETPDSSATGGTLSLSEWTDETEDTLSVIQTLEASSIIQPDGPSPREHLTDQYAAFDSVTLSNPTEPQHKEYRPKEHPTDWIAICRRFAPYAEKAMKPHAHLDETDYFTVDPMDM